MCNTNNCPAGIATKADLRQRLNVEKASNQLKNFSKPTELMQVMARAC
ncbi:glutamate synthase-related protein [Vibrio chagasii]|nr:glutamate synthase-related protein [Vibrio chagasii]